jgi:hypothetical protein
LAVSGWLFFFTRLWQDARAGARGASLFVLIYWRLLLLIKPYRESSMHETVQKEFKCPRTKNLVKLTLRPRDTNTNNKPVYTIESCDAAFDCGVAEHKYISIEYHWSKCPYNRWRFQTE